MESPWPLETFSCRSRAIRSMNAWPLVTPEGGDREHGPVPNVVVGRISDISPICAALRSKRTDRDSRYVALKNESVGGLINSERRLRENGGVRK